MMSENSRWENGPNLHELLRCRVKVSTLLRAKLLACSHRLCMALSGALMWGWRAVRLVGATSIAAHFWVGSASLEALDEYEHHQQPQHRHRALYDWLD